MLQVLSCTVARRGQNTSDQNTQSKATRTKAGFCSGSAAVTENTRMNLMTYNTRRLMYITVMYRQLDLTTCARNLYTIHSNGHKTTRKTERMVRHINSIRECDEEIPELSKVIGPPLKFT